MPVILATDITVVIDQRTIHGRKKRVEGTLEFGNGVDTMPPDGLPMPDISAFGFIRNIDEFRLYQRDGSTPLLMAYQEVDNKIVFIEPETEESNASGTLQSGSAGAIETPLKTTVNFVAIGW